MFCMNGWYRDKIGYAWINWLAYIRLYELFNSAEKWQKQHYEHAVRLRHAYVFEEKKKMPLNYKYFNECVCERVHIDDYYHCTARRKSAKSL